ncbi:MAG: helix-turn-helix transcriptional regulator [Ruminococcaceae bacterium]|nr:helix-turn-helix transcriptional regulator [Oscillospiraceae bacterium]
MENKINEQITFFRKQMNLTQDELANRLGVTNQAVSKWENDICCPDIQLLPKIAEIFDVSIDSLFGNKKALKKDDSLLQIKESYEALPKEERADFIFKVAALLHILILADYVGAPHQIGFNEAMEHIAKDEWGYSSYYEPKITTTMRKSSVFFADNKCKFYSNTDINKVCGIIKVFSVPDNLKTAAAIYQLTVHDEDVYVSIKEISDKSGISEEKITERISNGLLDFINEKEDEKGLYRLNGMYMDIIPILTLFAF